MMDFIYAPWPWYVAGAGIAVTMALLLFFGKSFGVSDNLSIMCSACGAGKKADFFSFNWKERAWNLWFVAGAILGGFISGNYLSYEDKTPAINPQTQEALQTQLGIDTNGYIPTELFSWTYFLSPEGFAFIAIGGFLIGFGARYAGGCTSGHAISGLSNLQLPSLIAVVGFFIGGLLMTHLILPLVL